MLDQRAQAAFRRRDAVERRLARRTVLAGLEIDRFLDSGSGRFVHPVEAALALAAGIALRDHAGEQLRLPVDVAVRVAGRQGVEERAADIGHQVQTDQIDQPEHAGLRDAHGAADHGVGLFHGQAKVHRLVDRGLNPVGADPVGDEAGAVLALHDALAQPLVGEGAEGCDGFGAGGGAGDHFQQAHVARRIEEVGDQEILGELFALALDQVLQRDGRGVGGDDGTGLPHLVQPGVEVRLDRGVLDHGFDDPVHARELFQIVVDVAGGDQPGVLLVHEGGGIGLQHLFDGCAGNHAAVVAASVLDVLRDDVEQEDRDAGIGDMRRDAAAHHAGADHGCAADFHEASPRYRLIGR